MNHGNHCVMDVAGGRRLYCIASRVVVSGSGSFQVLVYLQLDSWVL